MGIISWSRVRSTIGFLISVVVIYNILYILPKQELYHQKNELVLIFISIFLGMMIYQNNILLTEFYVGFSSFGFTLILLVNSNILNIQQEEIDLIYIFVISSIFSVGYFKSLRSKNLDSIFGILWLVLPFMASILIGINVNHNHLMYLYVIISALVSFVFNVLRESEVSSQDLAESYSWFLILSIAENGYNPQAIYIKTIYLVLACMVFRLLIEISNFKINLRILAFAFYSLPLILSQTRESFYIFLYLILSEVLILRLSSFFSIINIDLGFAGEFVSKIQNLRDNHFQLGWFNNKIKINLSLTICVIFIIIGLLSMV
jgi:hypothetical protein